MFYIFLVRETAMKQGLLKLSCYISFYNPFHVTSDIPRLGTLPDTDGGV